MFPNDYAFHWTPLHVIFLGIFFTVLIVVGAQFAIAIWRAARGVSENRYDAIRWQEDFKDLPPELCACRHALTGEAAGRRCPNAFDCRQCQAHPRFIARRPLPVESTEDIAGMTFPAGRYYHRGHAWAKAEEDGTVSVGLDELGRRLIGEAAADLPAPGATLRVNGLAWKFQTPSGDVRILSPVDGEVLATGDSSSEWMLKVKPTSGGLDTRHLLRGAEVKAWITRELERLQMAFAPEPTGATLADGGVLVEDLPRANPAADWDRVYGQIFLDV